MADSFTSQQDLFHPTIPRTMRDVELDFSRMDDINYLRYRNVQLETELRFLREQLAQAHSGTQYVISCFTKAHELNSTISISGDDPKAHRLRDHHALPSQPLGITQDDDEYAHENKEFRGRQHRSIDFQGFPYNHHSDDRYLTPSAAQPLRSNDLLTFEDDDSSLTATNIQSPAKSFQSNANSNRLVFENPFNTSFTSVTSIDSDFPRLTTRAEAQTTTVGLGIHKARSHHRSEVHPPWDLHTKPNYILETRMPQSKEVVFDATLPCKTDATVVPASTKQWCAIRSPLPYEDEVVFDRKFFDEEHNRLLNSACFIEEMTGEEREQHWMMLGREKGRHSAREWKLYYQKIIRPAYLAKNYKTQITPVIDSANVAHIGTVFAGQGEEVNPGESHPKTVDADSSKLEVLEIGLHGISHGKDKSDVVLGSIQTLSQVVEAPDVFNQAATEALPEDLQKSKLVEENQCSSLINKTFHDSENIIGDQLSTVATPSKIGEDADTDTTSSPAFGDLRATVFTPSTNSTSDMASPLSAMQPTTPLRRRAPFMSFPTKASQIFYKPAIPDSSHLRTIVISNVDSSMTLAEVVSRIRGGKLVRARFLETNGMKTVPMTTTNTVMIEFLSADDAAAAFDVRSQEEHSSQAAPHLFKITVLRTPTRPLHPKLEFDMLSRGLTRVFYIVTEQQKWTPEAAMQEIIRCEGRQKRPLSAGLLREDMLFFEYADVRDAAMAWEWVDRDRYCFRGVKKGFLPDPCSGSDDSVEGEKEATSGPDADGEGDGGSTAVNTPEVSFEKEAEDDLRGSDGAARN